MKTTPGSGRVDKTTGHGPVVFIDLVSCLPWWHWDDWGDPGFPGESIKRWAWACVPVPLCQARGGQASSQGIFGRARAHAGWRSSRGSWHARGWQFCCFAVPPSGVRSHFSDLVSPRIGRTRRTRRTSTSRRLSAAPFVCVCLRARLCNNTYDPHTMFSCALSLRHCRSSVVNTGRGRQHSS